MTEPQNQENPTPETTPESEPTSDAKYTDKDVDKFKGGARKEGRNTGRTEREQEILEATGAESVDDVLEAYKAWQTVQEETTTETDKERKAREKAEAERDNEIQRRKDADERATNILIRSELKASLMAADARQDRLARLVKEADLSSVEVEGDEVKNLEGVIETLKTEIPEWFGSSTTERKPSGFDGVPLGDPDGATKEQEQANKEIAARQIHRMF